MNTKFPHKIPDSRPVMKAARPKDAGLSCNSKEVSGSRLGNFTRRAMPFLVVALTFAVFLPVLKNGFVEWDDIRNFVNNQKYRGLGWEQLKWMFTSAGLGPYTPLTTMTFGLDFLIWGVSPFGYHLTSVVLHCINAVVFYFLCFKLFTLAAGSLSREKSDELYLSACFAALFFSIHPLRVESVAWLSGRHDILSCLFYMLAILLYIQPRSAGGENAPFRCRHMLPLAAFFLALLSKGMAISLPVVLVMFDIYPLRRLPDNSGKWFSRETRQIWLEKIPFFVLAAVFGIIGYVCQAKVGALASYQKFGFISRAAQSLFAVFLYIHKTMIPSDLLPLYRLADGFGLSNPKSLFAGTVIAAITVAVIVLRRRQPAGLAVWVYYLATLSPVAGIVKINSQAAADRYTYLPCLGFALLAGAGFRMCRQAVGRRLGNICVILACLVIAGLSFLTWRQEKIWRDSVSLWSYDLRRDPGNALAHNNLGVALTREGRGMEAVPHYLKALELDPNYADPHNNLAVLLDDQGRTAEAIGHYRQSLRLNADSAEPNINLAVLLAGQGKLNEAKLHYQQALRVEPGNAQAHNNLGAIWLQEGRYEQALQEFRQALVFRPDYATAQNNMYLVMKTLKKTAKAQE